MLVRFTLYKFYLRLAIYSVPTLAFSAAILLRFFAFGHHVFHPVHYLQVLLLVTPMWAAVAEWHKLTTVSRLFQERTGVISATFACAATYTGAILVLFLSQQFSISRIFIAISALLTIAFTMLFRTVIKVAIRSVRPPEVGHRTLIVGADRFARRTGWQLRHAPLSSVEIAGFLLLPGQEIAVPRAKVLTLEQLNDLRGTASIQDIVIAVPSPYLSALPSVMGVLKELCAPIRVAVEFGRDMFLQDKLVQVGQLSLLTIGRVPAESVRYVLLKRAFDIGFSLLAIFISSPIMALIALGIKLTSRGPILFTQDRVGLNGSVFKMYKFRTMRVSTGTESDQKWTTKSDPRCTAIGGLLRKTSLDELPQFFNVLRGHMSVVGPRPERPFFVERFRHNYSQYDRRHRLKVGITGWAQVNGLRGDTSIPKRVEYDLYYLQNWSLSFDLRIVLLTLFSGLVNRNAY